MRREPILRLAVDVPLARLFDYRPPTETGELQPGMRFRVPFGRRQQIALLVEIATDSDLPGNKLRRATACIDSEPLLDDNDLWLIRFTSDYYQHPIGEVVAAALPAALRQGKSPTPTVEALALTADGARQDADELARRAPRQAELLQTLQADSPMSTARLDEAVPGWRRSRKGLADKGLLETVVLTDTPRPPTPTAAVDGPPLNVEQKAALAWMRGAHGFSASLLDGVTGSGKTEVYLHRIRDTLDDGRQVLILVPEIGLTPQFVRRLKQRLGIEPRLLHSALPENTRLEAWRSARDGSALLLLGTRSAVFTPLLHPGLIIVDEEHDASFKQQEGLRYSARDLAVARAKQLGIPVILGSATPSLETLRRCHQGAYRRLVLSARAGNALPPLLRLVDLAQHPADDGLSAPLLAAIEKTLQQGGQTLIYLNRRGFAPTLICAGCGKIAECNRCDARMTVHAAKELLACHHCGASRRLERRCADCGNPCRPLGQGTERIEETLARHFPAHTVTRIDSDSTRLKGTMDRALALATSGEARILVGTQMLSKGHHFPNLMLVGIVNADQGLFSTDFRGGERLAQSLVQVAGRAGRERRQGEVMIQTAFAQHPFWQRLLGGGYADVAEYSLAEREAAAWPPYSRLALLRASAPDKTAAHQFLDDARRRAEQRLRDGVRILGPVSAPMERRAGRYRAQLLIQSNARKALHAVLRPLRLDLEEMRSARRVRWSIDVDPIELF